MNLFIYSTDNEVVELNRERHVGILTETMEMEELFYQGVSDNGVALYYQPKINALTREINGMEATIHWCDHRLLKRLLQYPFEHNLIRIINQWTLITAVSQLKEWVETADLNIPISLKIHPATIHYIDYFEELKQLIGDIGISPQLIELEITATSGDEFSGEMIEFVSKLKTLGVLITLGNFGEGPSFQSLKYLPLDGVKLANSLIEGLNSSHSSNEIVASLVDLARHFNLCVHAEGVKNEQEYQLLKELGCHSLQGYFYSRPLNSEEMFKVLCKKERMN